MKIIKSKENPIYKAALKLTKKKYRDETGRYLQEGIKPLKDAFDLGIAVRTVFIAEGTDAAFQIPEKTAVILDRKLFEGLSDTETSQGVIAVVEKRHRTAEDFAKAVGDGNLIILDRLQDPGNIGTIVRTAEAAGYQGIMVTPGTGDVYAPKVVRAAAGSLLRMPVFAAADAIQAVEMTRRMKKTLVVTSLEDAEDCFEADLTQDIALVIGNEGQGVGQSFLDAADRKIRIPMEGAIESLNAAVAAGILMYQSRKTK